LAAWLGGLCVGLALTADVVAHGLVGHVDWLVHRQVGAYLDGPLARAVLAPLAAFGQPVVAAVPLLGLAALAASRHRSIRPLLTAAGAVALTLGAVWLVKHGIGRLAPSAGRDATHAGGVSYPSGHAAAAVVCWGLTLEYAASLSVPLRAALPNHRRRALTALVGLVAGLAMAALDYHWLSDVVAGWLVGGLLLAAAVAFGPVRSPVRLAVPLPLTALPGRARRVPSG
jgi:membrane-associated phospholipid phosphatase